MALATGGVFVARRQASPAGVSPVPRSELALLAAFAAAALILWGAALRDAPYRDVGDLGLISVLPVWSMAAFIPFAAALAWLVHRPYVPLLPAVGLTLVMIAILYGTSPLLSGEPRIAAAWRHLGVIDFLERNGRVNPLVDVYHNWPGFFALAATLAQAAGVTDLRPIALWAPVWQNVLYLPALYLLLTSITTDRRVVWLAIWVFYAADWIGQDYLSPQGLGFFLYLVLVALFVRWLAFRDARSESMVAAAGWRRPGLPGTDAGATTPAPLSPLAAAVGQALEGARSRRAGAWITSGVTWILDRLYATRSPHADALPGRSRAVLAALTVAITGYAVTAHQLTPFFMLAATTGLLLLLRIRWFILVPLLLVMIAGWALFAAVPYLTGHLDQIAATSGAISGGVEANLGERLGGSADHRFVVLVRLVMTAGVWLLAGVGLLRRLLTGHWDVTAAVLASAPAPLFLLQSYGGEMLLRIALFVLPAMGLFIAWAFLPRAGRTSLARTALVGVLLLVSMGTFLLTRYGNERLETFTPDEVAAVESLYAQAPPGSMLLAINGNVPWKFTRYEEYRYRPSGDSFMGSEEIQTTAAEYPGPVFLIVTRSQRASAELVSGAQPGAFDTFVAGVMATDSFRITYQNPDGFVARYVGPTTAPSEPTDGTGTTP